MMLRTRMPLRSRFLANFSKSVEIVTASMSSLTLKVLESHTNMAITSASGLSTLTLRLTVSFVHLDSTPRKIPL